MLLWIFIFRSFQSLKLHLRHSKQFSWIPAAQAGEILHEIQRGIKPVSESGVLVIINTDHKWVPGVKEESNW